MIPKVLDFSLSSVHLPIFAEMVKTRWIFQSSDYSDPNLQTTAYTVPYFIRARKKVTRVALLRELRVKVLKVYTILTIINSSDLEDWRGILQDAHVKRVCPNE